MKFRNEQEEYEYSLWMAAGLILAILCVAGLAIASYFQ